MPTDLRLLAYAAILSWLQIMLAGALRSRGDLAVSFGNRDKLAEPTPMAARAERAARNMLENMVVFTALLLAAQGAGHDHHDRVVLGARIFFWARLAYAVVYVAGITYVRTALWAVGVTGMGLIVSTVF